MSKKTKKKVAKKVSKKTTKKAAKKTAKKASKKKPAKKVKKKAEAPPAEIATADSTVKLNPDHATAPKGDEDLSSLDQSEIDEEF